MTGQDNAVPDIRNARAQPQGRPRARNLQCARAQGIVVLQVQFTRLQGNAACKGIIAAQDQGVCPRLCQRTGLIWV